MNTPTKSFQEIIIPHERLPLCIFYFHGDSSQTGYPFHTHRDAELLFCVKGCLDLKIKEHTFRLKQDEYLYINPEEPHATICPTPNEILVLQISKDFISNFSDDPNFRIDSENMLKWEKEIKKSSAY